MQVSGDLLDLILIAVAAAFAVAGYRQGFIVGILSFVGFLGGGAVGAALSPVIAKAVTKSSTQQALVAIVVLFLAAMLGQLVASVLGASVRSRVTWRPVALVDAVGGAGVSAMSWLLIAWLLGSALQNAPFQFIASQVNRSAVLQGVDRFIPQSAHIMFSDFRRLVSTGPYTQVFGALGAEGALAVSPPDPAVVNSPGLARASTSIVKIVGNAPSCSRRIEGSGFVYAPGHVLTNAHVVAGVTDGPTVQTRSGNEFRATVVLYDPNRDLAVLDVPGLDAPSLHFLATGNRGDSAIVAGYPLNMNFTADPARIGGSLPAMGPNIYQTQTVTRQIYSVRALVRPGNSGGPLLSPDGQVYGVVFAAATGLANTGYALTAGEVASDANQGAGATAGVSTQTCD